MFVPIRDRSLYESPPNEINVWTERDYDILHTLCWRIRIVEISQMRRIWYPDRSKTAVRRRMRHLARFGLMDRYIVNAHPLIRLHKPLLYWEPDCKTPNAEMVAESSRQRWRAFSMPLEVFVAGRRAANLFGVSYQGLPSLNQRDSALLQTQVYAYYRNLRRNESSDWIRAEAFLDMKFPATNSDAFLTYSEGSPIHFIAAGSYTSTRIRSIHRRCSEYGISFELW